MLWLGLAALGLFMVLALTAKRGHWRTSGVLEACVLAAILWWAGCSGMANNSLAPSMTNPGTPIATYTLTVTGTATSGTTTVTHSVKLQLIVN